MAKNWARISAINNNDPETLDVLATRTVRRVADEIMSELADSTMDRHFIDFVARRVQERKFPPERLGEILDYVATKRRKGALRKPAGALFVTCCKREFEALGIAWHSHAGCHAR